MDLSECMVIEACGCAAREGKRVDRVLSVDFMLLIAIHCLDRTLHTRKGVSYKLVTCNPKFTPQNLSIFYEEV